MSLYSDTRDEIYIQINSVTGIGKVFKSVKYPTDWEAFFNLYRDSDTNTCIVTFITCVNPITETVDDQIGDWDASQFINHTHRTETWKISLVYAFKDDETAPSEYGFQELCERIEEKFRFLQDLNGKAFISYPLQSMLRDIGQWTGSIMVHKCDFHLQVVHRIENTATE